MTRLGVVEALYVTELVGLLIIFVGYRLSISTRKPYVEMAPEPEATPAD